MQYYEGWWRDHLDPEFTPIYEDFKVFLKLVWALLGLPEPTPAQYRIADYLQGRNHDGSIRETPDTGRAEIIMAFRGIGKSFITAAFVLWRLLRDPYFEKILVVSASSGKAKEFVSQVKAILMAMPLLAHLRPREDQRDQADRFDVNGASISQSPSLKAAGITGQIVGSRATLIVADDVEVVDNSKTEDARDGLLRAVNEFDAIKVPAQLDPETGEVTRPAGDVIFLGTPQTLESMYLKLMRSRGFGALCLPARVPNTSKLEVYRIRREDGEVIDILDPFILQALDAGTVKEWEPTNPRMFNEADLQNREAKGRSWFLLQYMLDTSLSDSERYPLKTADLLVMGINSLKAPATVQWGHANDKSNLIRDLPNVGFAGDKLLRPLFVDAEWRPYEQSVFFVDPSGRGKDETGWTHLKTLHGQFFIVDNGGVSGDVEQAMVTIATRAKAQMATTIAIEPNFAAGVWIQAFMPILRRIWPGGPAPEESDWAKSQKEVRIIDTLEPVLNTHRLVIDEAVLRADLKLEHKEYSLIYQLTHISRDRGSLRRDDRLDSLAGAISYSQQALGLSTQDAWEAAKEAELDEMLREFMEGPMPLRRGVNRVWDSRATRSFEREALRGLRGTTVSMTSTKH